MAETEKSEQPQTNGLENGLDEDERSKMRPADIDADVKEMERRKRVEMIMSSKLFREELERIIELQLKDGNGPAGLLQQISDMMGIQSGKLHTTHMFRGSNCVTPINDIRGVESMGYEKGEKNLRCKLASVFRLMDLYGWSQGINNQITARLNQDEEHFLVNPHGMLFNEITASSLVKVDMQGNVVEPGTTNFSVNTQGFLLHSAIHASRPDVNCVIHIKTPSVLAVSSLKCGLLPICQEALVIGEVSQHPFVSGIFEPEEREKIIRNLGPHNKVLLLHNHGAVCCGATVEEAFYNVYNTVLACETQMKLMPMGMDNLLLVSDETRKQVYDAAHRAPDASDKKKFRVGEMEFEALIRMLDNAGFRTGYIYRHPLVKGELPKPKNDVEVPPAVSSLGYLIEQEELYKQGNWKKYVDGRNRLDRTKWLNSPNVYQKVEILETGTSDPKKITKWVDQNSEEWVAESSPTHSSTPVKIDSALQFVPKGTNPKEFKKLQQQIKENRRADKITSGPQSHILEGVSWEDAKKLQDANITQTGDQVILVGAASKGIIQRNYQHNALVYKTPYAKNPFDSMSDKEIEDYKQLVERKQRGDTDYEESQSESEAISSSRQDALRHFKSPLLSPQSATSETEEESRDEPRVLRIETKTAPRPIQAEVVLSDAEPDTTDARVERSHSARYPKAEKPESVTLMNSFRKSWSLKREKDKSKDVESTYESRNLHPSFILKECERDRMASFHCCVARIKQLTHKPVIVDLGTKALRPLLKSASDPCNLSTLSDAEDEGDRETPRSKDVNPSLSCGNLNMSELQQRLSVRKKLLHSAKMKFLGFHKTGSEGADTPPNSPMSALISEIRETISEIMSPERSKFEEEEEEESAGYFSSMRWIERPRFVSRSSESGLGNTAKPSPSTSLTNFNDTSLMSSETISDFKVRTPRVENSDRIDWMNCSCAAHGGKPSELPSTEQDSNPISMVDENQNEEKPPENVLTEIVKYVNASDEEGTYTITDDSCLQTYSFTETTETEWYYNKTIMKLENSQTMLEIKETENKEENLDLPSAKYIDTGIDTDFTAEQENDEVEEVEKPKEQVEVTEDLDAEVPVCESSGLNKSSETDSSFLKSSSGRTSNDVDTSVAFKTETENSDKSPQKSANTDRKVEERNFLEEMLLKTKEPIEEESSDSVEVAKVNDIPQNEEEDPGACPQKPVEIPESPEFTNVDTEDAPVTSSSKDTSPEVAGAVGPLSEEDTNKEQEEDLEAEKENFKPERKRKKNVKSSTKITVKKELKENNSKEPVVSEIRLTIKNMNVCQSEKYEVKIQDVTNTSEELSRSVSSVGENVDSYESFEIMERSCDCEAQQNLEELQSEVSSTIEKLHSIEGYFEDEIKKHSNTDLEKRRNGSDEITFEYNYREFEEVLNESRDQIEAQETCSDDVPLEKKDGAEFFISSILGDICGEVEVCSVSNAEDGYINMCQEYENVPEGMPTGNDIEDMAMSSAFVAAILSEALEQSDRICEGRGVPQGGEVVQVFCNVEELQNVSEVREVEKCAVEVLDTLIDGLNLEEKLEISCEGRIDENEAEDKNCQQKGIGLEEEDCRDEPADVPLTHAIPDPDLQQEINKEEIGPQDSQNISDFMNSDIAEERDHLEVDTKTQSEENYGKTGHEDCQQAIMEADSAGEMQDDLSNQPISDSVFEQNVNCEEVEHQDSQKFSGGGDFVGDEVVTNHVTPDSEVQAEGIVNQECQPGVNEELSTVDIIDDLIKHAIRDSPQATNSDDLEVQQDCQQTNNEALATEFTDDSTEHTIVDSDLSKENNCESACRQINTEADTTEKDTDFQNHVTHDSNPQSENRKQDEEIVYQECPQTNTEAPPTEQITDYLSISAQLDSDLSRELNSEEVAIQEKNTEAESAGEITGDVLGNHMPLNSNLQPEDEVGFQECQQTKLEVNSVGEVKGDVLSNFLADVDIEDGRREEYEECQSGGIVPCASSEEKNDEMERTQVSEDHDVQPSMTSPDPEERLAECKDDSEAQPGSTELNSMDLELAPPAEDKREEHEFENGALPVESGAEEIGDAVTAAECKEDIATPQPEETSKNELTVSEITKLLFPPPLKAITFEPHTGHGTLLEKLTPVEYILNCLLTSVTEKNKRNLSTMNDVINFIVSNEESPTNSLTEFEDMENVISTSSSVVADIIDSIESQMEGEVESLPDEDDLKDTEGTKGADKRKRKKVESMFKVTIATPATKEIFINYSPDCSSTFNTSTGVPELCNSYIKTDEINEDFENLSSDNPEFFSVCSTGKNSLNSSFCSVEGHGDQFCCAGCEDYAVKSPRSLGIIQEVDEGDSSTSSEPQIAFPKEFPVQ